MVVHACVCVCFYVFEKIYVFVYVCVYVCTTYSSMQNLICYEKITSYEKLDIK